MVDEVYSATAAGNVEGLGGGGLSEVEELGRVCVCIHDGPFDD